MVSMLSAVWISCALVVVALAICSATVVATPKSTSAGVALNMLHPSHAPTAIKRRLKRTTAMEATKTSEERTPTISISGMESFINELKSVSTTRFQQLRFFWNKIGKKPDELFKLLELQNLNDELFASPLFLQWIEATKPSFPRDSTEEYKMEILSTLEKYYPNKAALTSLLAAGTMLPKTYILALDLLDMQLKMWLRSDVSVSMEELFTALKLDRYGINTLLNPRFLPWLQFFKSRYEKAIKNGNEAAFELAEAADVLAQSTIDVDNQFRIRLELPEYPFELKNKEAEKAIKAFEMATFLFLNRALGYHWLVDAAWKGSKVDNEEVKYVAKKLLRMYVGSSIWNDEEMKHLLDLTNQVSKPMSSS